MQYGTAGNFTSCAILLSEYIATVMMTLLCIDLCWLNVWNVGPGRTARTFVAIATGYAIDLTQKAVIGARCSMGSYVIATHAPFCFPNTPRR